jgi:hypothetical protein
LDGLCDHEVTGTGAGRNRPLVIYKTGQVSSTDSKVEASNPTSDSQKSGGFGMAKITEAELADVIEAILATRPNGEATIAELIDEIPNYVNLSPEDLAQSPTRPNESFANYKNSK